MQFEEYFYVICPLILMVFQGFTIWCANRKKRKMVKALRSRPNTKYIKARIDVVIAFKTHFSEIKRFAEESITPKYDANDDLIDSEKCLIDKLTFLYELLIENETEKGIIHKAVRFEIKSSCMKHPFDILGSQISKKIESTFQSIMNQKEKSEIHSPLPTFFSTMSGFIWRKKKKLLSSIGLVDCCQESHKASMIAVLVVVANTVVAYWVKTYGIWLEGGLVLFLEVICAVTVFVLTRLPSFSKYTFLSIIRSAVNAVFLTFGLYLYDYCSDLQVFNKFRSPDSCNGTSKALGRVVPTYSIFRYIKHLVKYDGTEEETFSISEVLGPLLVCILIVLVSTITTVPSLKRIINEIHVSLAVGGRLKELSQTPTEDQGIVSIPIESVISRSEISINEARTESIFQFMIQWSIYYTLTYWINLAQRAEGLYQLNEGNMNNFPTSIGNRTTQNLLTEEDICGLDKIIVFRTLWKSGAISLFSLSWAQYKANNVQHELCITRLQKILYFLSSACNTFSYTALVVLFATNLSEFAILIADTYHKYLYLCVASLALFVPLITRGIIVVLKKLFGMCCTFSWETGDEIITSGNGMLDLLNTKFFLLPTSQTPQNRFSYFWKCFLPFYDEVQMSYHTKDCPYLLTGFIDQCFSYIICFTYTSILGLLKLHLLHGSESLENLRNEVDISPTVISRARYQLLLSSCFVIPFGWVLGYVFLFLYFRYDEGYFSVSKLYFEYNSSLVSEVEKYSPTENESVGEWVDLSGQEESAHECYEDESTEITFENLLNLTESDNRTFKEIKDSFPYYRGTNRRIVRQRDDLCICIRFSLIICTFVGLITTLWWYLRYKY